jgi:DNA-binding IclR family transcriptional regulator
MKRTVAKVPALERGLHLLEWMASQAEPVTLTQIACGVSLGIPEVQRPVACLEELGYLRRLSSGAYELSGRLFGIASKHPPLSRLRRAAEPALAEFAAITGHSVHLSVPDGDAALMLLDVPGSGLVRLSLKPGARFAPANTLSGALLAAAGAISYNDPLGWPNGLARAALDREPFSWKSPQAAGVIDCGMILANPSNAVVGVITCSAVAPASDPLKLPPILRALRKTCSHISAHC